MAPPSRLSTRPLLTLAIAGVLAMGLSGAGLADPWMAFVSDTGLFDTGSAATDDTGSPGDDTGSPGDDTGTPGGGDGDDTGSPDDDTGTPGGGDSDDTGSPSGGDTGSPDADDTGDVSDDTGDVSDDTGDSADDTGAPEEDAEPIDTGGKSAAELAGETGGCGCATSAPPSGMVIVLVALGLVVRRRSVS